LKQGFHCAAKLGKFISQRRNLVEGSVMPKISVGVRLRPLDGNAERIPGLVVNTGKGGGKPALSVPVGGTTNEFIVDHLFHEQSSQGDVFHGCVEPIVDSALEGFNGCVFAYGQTGSGKTHTIAGSTSSMRPEARGQTSLTAAALFRKIREQCSLKPEVDFSVRVSALEIYNETLLDLLVDFDPGVERNASTIDRRDNNTHGAPSIAFGSSDGSAGRASKLSILDLPTGILVPELYILPVGDQEAAFDRILEALSNRAVAEHQLNRQSSRSHMIFTFYVTRTRQRTSRNISNSTVTDDPDVSNSKLHLVDLAGSERIKNSKSVGEAQTEARHINRSLSFLEQVVVALTQRRSSDSSGAHHTQGHVPYRSSKLTYLLKDCLGGNCNTVRV
jgi:kinesin family protein 6/9